MGYQGSLRSPRSMRQHERREYVHNLTGVGCSLVLNISKTLINSSMSLLSIASARSSYHSSPKITIMLSVWPLLDISGASSGTFGSGILPVRGFTQFPLLSIPSNFTLLFTNSTLALGIISLWKMLVEVDTGISNTASLPL